MSDYRQMWAEMGLDLKAHDMLLGALGQMYKDTFLSQPNRPESMSYFDFVISEAHGLRIKELQNARAQGRKVVGSFCLYVPEELILAVEGVAIGLCGGAEFGKDEAEKLLPQNTCALIKSFFGFKMTKVCPYMEASDMVVGETTCDGKKKAYEIFRELQPNFYLMEIPQMKNPVDKKLLKAEYRRFKEQLEELTGVTIDASRLRKGIGLVNNRRKALARLAALRSVDPSPISGLDGLLINQVAFYDDPVRFTDSVNRVCQELEGRVDKGQGVFEEGAPRILISGCPMSLPNWKLPRVIEACGGVVVAEESCVGERGTRNLVDDSGKDVDALMDAIADRYFQIDCAIFTPNPDRVAHIEEMVERSQADGVIHYALQFCSPYTVEAYSVERQLKAKGIPVARIETDYGQDTGQLTTRIQAFLEMINK